MNIVFSEEEKYLIALLKNIFTDNGRNVNETEGSPDTGTVVSLAKRHAVLPLLYDVFVDNELFVSQLDYIKRESRQTVLQSYRLLFLTKHLVEILEAEKINVAVLKGVATGSMYPVPELRKSGDVDLLIPCEVEYQYLVEIMEKEGFRLSEHQHANHHIVFVSMDGISVEIHKMPAEPFVYKQINRAMERMENEYWNHLERKNIMGVELPILDKPFHAYTLLLHMLQHFMYAGFGLKLLCDWVVIWNENWTEQEKCLFVEVVNESGLKRFAEGITSICVKYLGLEAEYFAWEIIGDDMSNELLREIMDAEDFGNSNDNRMVMMKGTGITAYISEFHHQMHLNFPKAGKCVLLWPVLWIMTLVKFLYNNFKLRKTSTRELLKEANRRSELMNRLKLFK